MLGINYIVGTNSLGIMRKQMETLLKSKIPDTSQGLTLEAGLSKDSSQAFSFLDYETFPLPICF